MFNNLIESESHRDELLRKSRFFLGTLAFYALLFAVGGVASIYAYDAHLANQSLELVTLLPPVEAVAPAPETPRNERPSAQQRTPDRMADVRQDFIASVETPTLRPDNVSSVRSNIPPVRAGIPTVRGDVNTNAAPGGPVGPAATGDGGTRIAPSTPRVVETEPPPAMSSPTPAPTPVPANYVKSLGAVTGQMLNRPNLNYPPMAKMAGIQGPVTVQVVIDETGKVISARAVSGNPMLRQAAEQAAHQARFSPTLLSHQPVKASGTITFNFILQK